MLQMAIQMGRVMMHLENGKATWMDNIWMKQDACSV